MLLTVDLNEGPTDYGSLLGCGTRARSGTLTWAVLVEHLGAGSALDAIGVPTRADDGDVRDSGVILTQLCERHPGVATVVGVIRLDRRDCRDHFEPTDLEGTRARAGGRSQQSASEE